MTLTIDSHTLAGGLYTLVVPVPDAPAFVFGASALEAVDHPDSDGCLVTATWPDEVDVDMQLRETRLLIESAIATATPETPVEITPPGTEL